MDKRSKDYEQIIMEYGQKEYGIWTKGVWIIDIKIII